MCGIAGQLRLDGSPACVSTVKAMTRRLTHRGPDDEGFFFSGAIGLGFRRLSVIDLAGGHQPMANEDESVWIVFNGEIYNYLELRSALTGRGHAFRTSSDTEAIIHLYEEYGCDCVNHLDGMFAFAIWDARRQRLLLARDRLGKKPLVYSQSSGVLSFASEIGALLEDPAVPRELDPEALDLYMTLLYVPSPWTMLLNVHKLEPAHYLVWEEGRLRLERYWDVEFTADYRGTEGDAAIEVRRLLEAAVRRRTMSDVPLGAFLSGGIDSSAVVAILATLGHRPVQTFSVAFEDGPCDDWRSARAIAARYATDHHELKIGPDMVKVLPRLVAHYGEPFADSSAIATFYVSEFARRSVTVALSGDGGDEVFGGYSWYVDARRPAALARAYVRDGGEALQSAIRQRSPRAALGALKGTSVGLGIALRGWWDPAEAFRRLVSYQSPAQRQALYSRELLIAVGQMDRSGRRLRALYQAPRDADCLGRMSYVDHHSYLPDDILVKVDIASMANGLEVRAPFLDRALVEFAATLPARMKVQHQSSKRVLRLAVADLLPAEILTRSKVGFGIPVDRWLRDDLSEMTRDLLLDRTATARGLFRREETETMLRTHGDGQPSGYRLWALLVFEIWCRSVLDARRLAA